MHQPPMLSCRGPPAISKGLAAAIKDQFPDVKEVVFKEFPAATEAGAAE